MKKEREQNVWNYLYILVCKENYNWMETKIGQKLQFIILRWKDLTNFSEEDAPASIFFLTQFYFFIWKQDKKREEKYATYGNLTEANALVYFLEINLKLRK